MELVKDEMEVLDGYVQFEIEHCSEYILSLANLNLGKDFNIFMLISILEFIIIIGYIGYIKFIYKDRKKK